MNIILSSSCELHYDDVTVTSFVNDMAMLLLKASRKRNIVLLFIFCGQKGLLPNAIHSEIRPVYRPATGRVVWDQWAEEENQRRGKSLASPPTTTPCLSQSTRLTDGRTGGRTDRQTFRSWLRPPWSTDLFSCAAARLL